MVGLQCGGSDALSGVSANPALGVAADLIMRAGGTVLLSEVPEVRDGIDRLVARTATHGVVRDLIREMAWYDAYLTAGGSDRSANTTPGNKKSGLSKIVEKAMGSITKSGSMPTLGVVAPGERASQKGLLFAATPASDFICGTLQITAGMNVHVFTAGRGTPFGRSEVPVIKESSRAAIWRGVGTIWSISMRAASSLTTGRWQTWGKRSSRRSRSLPVARRREQNDWACATSLPSSTPAQ